MTPRKHDVAKAVEPAKEELHLACGSLHDRNFRRFRRSFAPKIGARAVRTGGAELPGAALCDHRLCAHANDRRSLPADGDRFRKEVRRCRHARTKPVQGIRQALAYVSGDYHDPEAFEKLKKRLEELDRAHKLDGNRLFYLATPPEIYP